MTTYSFPIIEHDNRLAIIENCEGYQIHYWIEEVLVDCQTEYQKMHIVKSAVYGGMLFLDGELQIAEIDNDVYNKTLVNPIFEVLSDTKNILILGGGDGGVLREIFHQSSSAKVTLVDIDKQVIEASKNHLPQICGDAFDNPNANVIVDDAYKYLDKNLTFDAIVYDLTMHPDFIGISRELFLTEIFTKINKSLKSNGVFTMQCCSQFDQKTQNLAQKILSQCFTQISFFPIYISSFCEPWIFMKGRKKE